MTPKERLMMAISDFRELQGEIPPAPSVFTDEHQSELDYLIDELDRVNEELEGQAPSTNYERNDMKITQDDTVWIEFTPEDYRHAGRSNPNGLDNGLNTYTVGLSPEKAEELQNKIMLANPMRR